MQISLKDFLEKEKTGSINIIDIRDNYQYNQGHIGNAKNIQAMYLLGNPSKYLNKNTIYYIYCEYGNTSRYVSNQLNNLGYRTINIAGGYSLYQMSK